MATARPQGPRGCSSTVVYGTASVTETASGYYFPDIWCKPGEGYCVLELLAEPFFTKLKGDSAGRYVMKAPQETDEAIGSKCRLIQVMALWCIYSDVPSSMVL